MEKIILVVKGWILLHPSIVSPTLGCVIEELFHKHPWLEFCVRLVLGYVVCYLLFQFIDAKVPSELQILCYFFIGAFGYDILHFVIDKGKDIILDILEAIIDRYRRKPVEVFVLGGINSILWQYTILIVYC
jgi:hypothetical protein